MRADVWLPDEPASGLGMLKQPKALLLDEPSLGLSSALSQRLLDSIVAVSTERNT
jgi:ABC-type branched-subunit amino acid transport system ATPase component